MNYSKTIKLILAIILFMSVIYGVVHILSPYLAMWMDFSNPRYYDQLKEKWQDKSSDFLISKLGQAKIYDSIATTILARRRGLDKEEKLIQIVTQDTNQRKRSSALSILFSWDDKKAKDLAMTYLKQGRSNPLFADALLHLSKRKYEPAYPFALELANAPDRYNNGSAAYLGDFGKKESIPILERMLEDTNNNIDQVIILRAIQNIKEQNQI